MWLYSFYHQEVEPISLYFDSDWIHVTCFGQWDVNRCDLSRGFRKSFFTSTVACISCLHEHVPRYLLENECHRDQSWVIPFVPGKDSLDQQFSTFFISWLSETNYYNSVAHQKNILYILSIWQKVSIILFKEHFLKNPHLRTCLFLLDREAGININVREKHCKVASLTYPY